MNFVNKQQQKLKKKTKMSRKRRGSKEKKKKHSLDALFASLSIDFFFHFSKIEFVSLKIVLRQMGFTNWPFPVPVSRWFNGFHWGKSR